ncbi:MarR family winged helix-turn-helix transcriptional regulator [Myceligenerans halotolerans]
MGDAFATAKEAADDESVVAFGRFLGAASRLEHVLGREIEERCGISHLMFEVLLILARAGEPGLSMRTISREQVLTTGGVTRLIDRMEVAGLVERSDNPADRRGRIVRLTAAGEAKTVEASSVHLANIQRYFLEPLRAEHRAAFAENLRILSRSAGEAVGRLR